MCSSLYSQVEVFFSDTGRSGRVSLSEVCNGNPPMLPVPHRQAVQCTLQGVELVLSLCVCVCVCV